MQRARFGADRFGLRRLTVRGTAAAGAVLAVVALVVELLRPMPWHDPGIRAAIETTITIWALMTAGLLLVRWGDTRQRSDLMLLGALAAVSLSDFVFSALPAIAGSGQVLPGTGASLGCEGLVAIAFAAAAFAPQARLEGSSRRPVALAVLAGLGAVALTELIGVAAGGASTSVESPASGLAAAAHHPVALGVAIASAATLIAAGVGFVSRTEGDDREAGMLAGAAFVLAAARLQYLAMPAVGAGWVTPREVARLVAYALLLAVAVRTGAGSRHAVTRAAVRAERQRIARELHDSLAQDLAFIAAHSDRLASELGVEHQLTIAARRALAASRGTIIDLAASSAPTTLAALRSVADELASRFAVEVDVRLGGEPASGEDADLDPTEREQVVRIAREAIVNAVRHGGARHITVELGLNGCEHLLRVADDGQRMGAPATDAVERSGGFGIPSMRARAASVGGQLVARAGNGGGTEVEVLTS